MFACGETAVYGTTTRGLQEKRRIKHVIAKPTSASRQRSYLDHGKVPSTRQTPQTLLNNQYE